MVKNVKTIVLALLYFAVASADFHFFNFHKGIDAFYADTTAHKMRLVTRIQELLDNPKFYEAMPEYKELEKYKEQVIRLAMEHDSSKLFLSKDDPIIKIAGKMEGKDWRSLPDSNPLKAQAKAAFDTLTDIDTHHEGKSAVKLFPNESRIRELAEDMVKMGDFDDVPKGRGLEFGEGKGLARKLTPASEWVQKPNISKDISPERLKRLVKLGKVLEQPDFAYSKNILFYTADRVKGKKIEHFAKPFFETRYKGKTLQLLEKDFTYARALVKKQGLKGMVTSTSGFAKAVRILPAAAVVGTRGYSVAKNPDQNIPEETIKSMLFISSKEPSCRGFTCHKFLLDCKRKTGSKKLDWDYCVKYFYTLSLEKQDSLLLDPDLKSSLARSAPVISNLRCQDSSKENNVRIEFMHISALGYGLKSQWQTLFFKNDSTIDSLEVDRMTKEDATEKVLYGAANRPSLVQKCEQRNKCENVAAVDVMKYGIKAPKSSRGMNFVSLQKDNIQRCCGDNSCKAYFNKKYKSTATADKTPELQLIK